MRRRKAGRITAWLLSAALIFGQAPMTAFAEENTEAAAVAQESESRSVSDGNQGSASGSQIPATVSDGNRTDLVLNNDEGIPDKALYDALLAVGDSNGDGELTKSEAESVSYLYMYDFDGHLTNLSVYAPNLLNLNVYATFTLGTELHMLTEADMREISQLTQLTSLQLGNLKMEGAGQLAALHNLNLIIFNNNLLDDIGFITAENFPELLSLNLSGNPLMELPAAIAGLTKLTDINLGNCELRKLADLTGLTQLVNLNLYSNKLTAEEIRKNVPEKFSGDENWMSITIDPNYDPTTDDYYPENKLAVTNDADGIPDRELYAILLQQGDQYLGNSDGILTVGEARKITSLQSSSAVLDYTNLAEFAPNITYLYVNNTYESNWKEAESSFLQEYALLTKLKSINLAIYTDEMLSVVCNNKNLTQLQVTLNKAVDLTPVSGLPLQYFTVWGVPENSGIEQIVNSLQELSSLSLNGRDIDPGAINDEIKARLTNFDFAIYYGEEKKQNIDFSAFTSAMSISVTCPIDSVTGLSGLPLVNLTLSNNGGAGQLAEALPESLKSLSLSNVKVENLTTKTNIASLNELDYLSLNNCGINDLSGISGLTGLWSLNLSGNSITHLSELLALKNLNSLNLEHNELTDVSGIEQLTQLTSLNLGDNLLESLPDLSGLTKLSGENITFYYNSLVLIGNQLTRDAIVGKVPEMFSNNRIWLAKAAGRIFNNNYGMLYYTELDSQTIADIIYEYSHTGTIYKTIDLVEDGKAVCTPELIQLLKDKDIHLTFNFVDNKTAAGKMRYYLEGKQIEGSVDHDLVFRYISQPSDIANSDAAAEYFSEYGQIPIYYYQNNLPDDFNNLPFDYLLPTENANYTSYSLYFYDYNAHKVEKVENTNYSYNSVSFSNYTYNTNARKINEQKNKNQTQGYYFLVDSKYTVSQNNDGEYSDPKHYSGEYYSYESDINKILKDKVSAAVAGDSIKFAYMGSVNISAEVWNIAVDKKLNWEITCLNYQKKIELIVKIKGTDTEKILENQVISSYVTSYIVPDGLKHYFKSFITRQFSMSDLIKNAEVTLYVGNIYRNGETLNLYYYTYPTRPTDSSNNTVPDKDSGYKIYESGVEPMKVSYGMVTYRFSGSKGIQILVNGKLDLEKEPEEPTPEEPEEPVPDTPEEPDTPDTDEPAPDGKRPPETIDEGKIVGADEALDVISEKMSHLDPNIEVYTKAPISLDKNTFQNMSKENKNVSVSVVNEKNQLMYGWTFRHDQISQEKLAEFEKLDLGISFNTEKKQEIEAITHNTDSLYLNFSHHGELPAPATIKTYVGDQYPDGAVVHLYYYNEETNKVEAINGSGGLVVSGGYVTYTITHCSIYFLSTATPEQLGLETNSGSSGDSGDGDTSAAAVPASVEIKSPKTGEGFSAPGVGLWLLMLSLSATVLVYRKAERR